MESQPQNPEFRNNPEKVNPCPSETKTLLYPINGNLSFKGQNASGEAPAGDL